MVSKETVKQKQGVKGKFALKIVKVIQIQGLKGEGTRNEAKSGIGGLQLPTGVPAGR